MGGRFPIENHLISVVVQLSGEELQLAINGLPPQVPCLSLIRKKVNRAGNLEDVGGAEIRRCDLYFNLLGIKRERLEEWFLRILNPGFS